MSKFSESGTAGSVQNFILAIFLTAVLLGTAAAAYYFSTMSGEGEAFTEFYIDPPDGVAEGYPATFFMQGDDVVSVSYGDGGQAAAGEYGRVILGIINREYQEAAYLIEVTIDGEPVEIILGDTSMNEMEPIVLAHQEKWEQEVGFSPLHTGDGQKVEFTLYKDGVACFEESLYLWIDVKEQG